MKRDPDLYNVVGYSKYKPDFLECRYYKINDSKSEINSFLKEHGNSDSFLKSLVNFTKGELHIEATNVNVHEIQTVILEFHFDASSSWLKFVLVTN